MSGLLDANIANWLKAERVGDGLYKTTFQTRHLGNVFIRSLHGGTTGAMIEVCALETVRQALEAEADLLVSSTSIDYLRVTKDADLYARATIQRISRRIAFVDVTCWQDSEEIPVARGVVTIKINRSE